MKKKNFEQADLTFLKNIETKKLLAHILSPLEVHAFKHNYQPFNYKLDGVSTYIPGYLCKQLITITRAKTEWLIEATEMHRASKDIPLKLRETFYDPTIIFSLNPSIRNRLCRLDCYTMFSIMHRGRNYFIQEKFGKKAMQTLDEMFEEHGMGRVFKGR